MATEIAITKAVFAELTNGVEAYDIGQLKSLLNYPNPLAAVVEQICNLPSASMAREELGSPYIFDPAVVLALENICDQVTGWARSEATNTLLLAEDIDEMMFSLNDSISPPEQPGDAVFWLERVALATKRLTKSYYLTSREEGQQ